MVIDLSGANLIKAWIINREIIQMGKYLDIAERTANLESLIAHEQADFANEERAFANRQEKFANEQEEFAKRQSESADPSV